MAALQSSSVYWNNFGSITPKETAPVAPKPKPKPKPTTIPAAQAPAATPAQTPIFYSGNDEAYRASIQNPTQYTGQGLLTNLPQAVAPVAGDTTDLRNVLGSGWGQGAVRLANGGYMQGDIAAFKTALNAAGANLKVDNNYDDAFSKALKQFGSKAQGVTIDKDPNTGETRYTYTANGGTGNANNSPNPFAQANNGQGVQIGSAAQSALQYTGSAGTTGASNTNYQAQAEAQVNPQMNAALDKNEKSRLAARDEAERYYASRGMGASSALAETLAKIDSDAAANASTIQQNASAQITALAGQLSSEAQSLSMQQQQLALQTRAADLEYDTNAWQLDQAKKNAADKGKGGGGKKYDPIDVASVANSIINSSNGSNMLNGKTTAQYALETARKNKDAYDQKYGKGAGAAIIDTLTKKFTS